MNSNRGNELHEVTLFLFYESEKAFKVSETGEEKDHFWLPKSQLKGKVEKQKLDTILVAEVPEWLCVEKGLAGF